MLQHRNVMALAHKKHGKRAQDRSYSCHIKEFKAEDLRRCDHIMPGSTPGDDEAMTYLKRKVLLMSGSVHRAVPGTGDKQRCECRLVDASRA